ncbi:YdhW family putative oxidoreductase system protein [Telmatospirillum sp.]|uniref:YdhW family putative oxidoreductase system protein n=1 Tax=Telmatospirillum sp. TaxID=2079197 RepID=UPI00284EA9C8|nr:YdhW family putative oxidoreductase system protein [Telmatospirillum sp.]MDR3439108.1 YdhW family putative oxidoreductase system protein [Telmatospirillum sp.]
MTAAQDEAHDAAKTASATENEERPDLGRRRFLRLTNREAQPAAETVVPESVVPEPVDAQPGAITNHIRQCSRQASLTKRSAMTAPPFDLSEEKLVEVLADIAADPECADIVSLAGDSDHYYYSEKHMTANYAGILFSLSEKNADQTLAEAVRFECKTYPRPYHVAMLKQEPYYFDDEKISAALSILRSSDIYRDIKPVYASNGELYLYSDITMEYAEAQGLCEWFEVECHQNP